MVRPIQPMKPLTVQVSEKVARGLDVLAKDAGMKTSAFAGLLFDAAYAARVKGTPDAGLDAHVALVGLATLSDGDLQHIAIGSGLPIEVVHRMRDGWKAVLQERNVLG